MGTDIPEGAIGQEVKGRVHTMNQQLMIMKVNIYFLVSYDHRYLFDYMVDKRDCTISYHFI